MYLNRNKNSVKKTILLFFFFFPFEQCRHRVWCIYKTSNVTGGQMPNVGSMFITLKRVNFFSKSYYTLRHNLKVFKVCCSHVWQQFSYQLY